MNLWGLVPMHDPAERKIQGVPLSRQSREAFAV